VEYPEKNSSPERITEIDFSPLKGQNRRSVCATIYHYPSGASLRFRGESGPRERGGRQVPQVCGTTRRRKLCREVPARSKAKSSPRSNHLRSCLLDQREVLPQAYARKNGGAQKRWSQGRDRDSAATRKRSQTYPTGRRKHMGEAEIGWREKTFV